METTTRKQHNHRTEDQSVCKTVSPLAFLSASLQNYSKLYVLLVQMQYYLFPYKNYSYICSQNKKHYGNKHNTTQNRNISVPNPQGGGKDGCGKMIE